MLKHDAESFCIWSSMIGQLLVSYDMGLEPSRASVGQTFGNLMRESERLQMPGMVRKIQRLKDHHLSGDATTVTMHVLISEIYNGLRDDLSDRLFLAVPPRMADYYDPTSPLFGAEVETKFPSLIYDVEEAGKCLALDRATASAFHSIRCLEAGVRAMSGSLSIPDPTRGADRSWAKLLTNMKTELERRWPSSTGRMAGDPKLFDEAYGALSGMQNPYRNSTMHLDEKYTLDEAEHILAVVKGFMKKLAERMDEDGLPLA